MSLFSTLYTANSGLQISKNSTSVAGNNIANAQNEDYTRQRLDMTEASPYYKNRSLIGTGVKAEQIVRLHSDFVYDRFRKAGGDLEHKQFLEKVLVEIAQLFPDIKNVGPQEELNKFFDSWQKLAANPADNAQKIVVAENSANLARSLRTIYQQMTQVQKNLDNQLKSTVDEVNRLGKKIAQLNIQIKTEEATKYVRANTLRDKRDELEKALTKLIDPTISKQKIQTMTDVDKNIADYDEDYSLLVGGLQLVRHDTFHPIELSQAKHSIKGFKNIFFRRSDHSLIEITKEITGGKIGAILKLRGKYFDKNTGETIDGQIQKFKNKLNSFATGLMQSINTIYAGSSTQVMTGNQIGNTTSLDVDQQKRALSDLYPEKLRNKVQKGDMVFTIYDIQGRVKRELNVTIDPNTQDLRSIAKKIDDAFKKENIDARAIIEKGILTIKRNYLNNNNEVGAVLLKRDDTLITEALDLTGFKSLRLVDKRDIPFNIEDGKFTINVYDSNGKTLASRDIIIDKSSKNPLYSTLEGIAAQINMKHQDDNKDHNYANDVDDFLEADFVNNKFHIEVKDKNAKLQFNITKDETGFSGGVGMHRFFDGSGAEDMELKREFKKNSAKINAYGKSVEGDNKTANKMQQLQYEKINFYDKEGKRQQETVMEQYRYVTGTIASDTHDIQSKVDASKAVYKSIKNKQQAISGVNIDEEIVSIIKFQAGYGANAKVISTIQTMLDTLLSIKV